VKGNLILGGCALLLFTSLAGALAQVAPELREDGVLYFEGNLPEKITATTQGNATVYLHRDFQTALAALYAGQNIELIGMAQEGYLLKTNYRNNTLIGWIRPADLPPGIDPALLAAARKKQAHRDAVAVAVANKTVIQGMTPDEVKQSVGRPEQVSSHSDANGSVQSWTYTTYREDPQYSYALNAYGQPFLQTYYVKVPVGKLQVDFANGAVTAVSQLKTDPNSPGIVTNSQ
jgi:hypothetical protein